MRFGHFEFTVMSFGINQCTNGYHGFDEPVCKPYLDKFFIVIIDDILIHSKSEEDHEAHLKFVLELQKKEKLFGKFSKCEFWLREVHFLIHVVKSDGIFVDSSKIESMNNWKVLYRDTSNQGLRYVLMQRGKLEGKSKPRRVRVMSIRSSVMNKILVAQGEVSKVRNTTAEMLCGLDQQIKKKEDGGLYFIDRGWDFIDRLKAARDHQKSYADNRRKLLEFKVGDRELLKVSPWKGVIRFGKKGKWHREEIKIDKTLRFVVEPVEIIDCEVKSLKRSKIPIVKVRWNLNRGPEFTRGPYES
uniref:Putative reverse transcriptase domain-containing protein n=1 Tax=Tanacetum cinerariifolium TaxID=118510 RepID=A0A6L2NDR1_TANCI|nr:putative reverse transcriptase domain-containing protein [Tanacetum cinerariifolium]